MPSQTVPELWLLNFLRFDVTILLPHSDSNVTCSLAVSVFECASSVFWYSSGFVMNEEKQHYVRNLCSLSSNKCNAASLLHMYCENLVLFSSLHFQRTFFTTLDTASLRTFDFGGVVIMLIDDVLSLCFLPLSIAAADVWRDIRHLHVVFE